MMFIALMTLFGTKLYWTKKAELGFISAGIYTRAKKSPWVLDKYKDKNAPALWVWKIYLNGNTLDDFESKRKNLNSEIGINIKRFEPLGTQMLLMYAVKDHISKKRQNRDDMNF